MGEHQVYQVKTRRDDNQKNKYYYSVQVVVGVTDRFFYPFIYLSL